MLNHRERYRLLKRAAWTVAAVILPTIIGPAVADVQGQTCGGNPNPTVPSPTNVRAVVVGTTVTISWTLQPGTTALLCAYRATGEVVFEGLLGAVNSVSGSVPPGTYNYRVYGTNATGQSLFTTHAFTVASAAALPGAPGAPTFTRNDPQVTLSWSAPIAGGAVSDYVLEVGSAPGTSNLATVSTPGTTFSATAAPAIYYVRVRARNVAGTGPPSPELVLNLTGGLPPAGSLRPCSVAVLSRAGGAPATVELVNLSNQGRLLHWIDWFGDPMILDAVQPRQTKVLSSFTGASFYVTDVFNRCLGTFVVAAGARFVIP